ncbi:MAG TPA: ATP-dependent protease ATPase subunit HslU [Fimbriimonadaceae bacterium]|nr:ATP-dependent protease ATPase subunit HslU [Fimbriimonadaceae bacterium]HRJ33818.1 ATP-dependent protease ATPase subunit HslU [Fimbriimonadaceae bacterium]
MLLPLEDLTPRQIVAELDKYIVGQANAKRAVAVALRNRYRRQQLPPSERDDILPKNILMIGPTGVGKTEIARRLAQLARAPFIKVEATKFTEVGYVGRDVESMIRDLAAAAVRLVERERMEAVRPEAEVRTREILADMLMEQAPAPPRSRRSASNPLLQKAQDVFGAMGLDGGTTASQIREDEPDVEDDYERRLAEHQKRRARILKDLKGNKLDSKIVEIETEESGSPFVQVFTPQGLEEMGIDLPNLQSPFGGSRRGNRSLTVGEAKEVLAEQEARRMIDTASLHRDAIHRAEQTGIIFLDEIDKIAGKQSGSGPDVSREGVQRDLLPIIEGSTVASKFGPVKTDHILFVAAGAFHMSRPSDLIPELQGRLPIRVELESLGRTDFRRILSEPKNALTKQYQLLLKVEGIELSFEEDALDEIATLAESVNSKTENIGARRLHTLLEKLLEAELFEAPEISHKKVVVTRSLVADRLGSLVQDSDLSRYIL